MGNKRPEVGHAERVGSMRASGQWSVWVVGHETAETLTSCARLVSPHTALFTSVIFSLFVWLASRFLVTD